MYRGVLAAAAAFVAFSPAQADLTVTISGSGVFDPTAAYANPQSTVALYGQNIAFTTTYTLTKGIGIDATAEDYAQYIGTVSSFSVNGTELGANSDEEARLTLLAIPGERRLTLLSTAGTVEGNGIFLNFDLGGYNVFGAIPRDLAQFGPAVQQYAFLNVLSGSTGAQYSITSYSVAFDGTDPLLGITQTNDVPEPAIWAMMIAGFGLAGSAIRSARVRRLDRQHA